MKTALRAFSDFFSQLFTQKTQKAPRQWSLSKTLIAWYGLSFVTLIVAGNLFQYWLLNGVSEADRSAILSDRMSAVSTLLKSTDLGKEELFRRVTVEWPMRGGEKTFLAIWDSGKHLVVKTPDFPPQLFQEANEAIQMMPSPEETLHLRNAAGQIVMARAERMINGLGIDNPVYVFGSISGDENHNFMDRFRHIAIGIVIASLLISLAISWQIAQKGISPVKQMTETVSTIHSRTLHERILIEDLPIELHQLAMAFNETLDKLEDSFGRLSRFSSDIAHELRTPLSNMLGEIEVTLSRPRASQEYEDVLGSSLEECARMKQTIESLLFLARAENRESAIIKAEIDPVAEIEGMIEFFEASASAANLALNYHPEPVHTIAGDRNLFQRVVGNLISNAIRYTTSGGNIEIVCRNQNGFVQIQVADNGPGIKPEHLKRIFDRFYRVDSARSGSTGGVGLGLSIAKSIVELHNGKIEIFSSEAGTTVHVDWPAWKTTAAVG